MPDPGAGAGSRQEAREEMVRVDFYQFLSDLAENTARTAANERGLGELRIEFQRESAANAVKFTGLESHLAKQDDAVARLREEQRAQHQAVLTTIASSMQKAIDSSTASWNDEHAPLLKLYEEINVERKRSRAGQKRLANIGTAVVASLTAIFAVIVAGSLSRLSKITDSEYFISLGVLGVILFGSIVWTAVNRSPDEITIVP